MPVRRLIFSAIAISSSALAVAQDAVPPSPLSPAPKIAGDIHVDPATGIDSNDGRTAPVKTIARAIKLSKPGDTVHLARATYFESLDLSLKHGEPGRPITVDGHGSTLEGSEPVRASDWENLGNGLYRKVKLMPRMDDAMLARWFFLWGNKMNRMGRGAKGPIAPLKKPAELAENEWTYLKDEDAFYLRVPAGPGLDAAGVRYPARSNAVAFGGNGSHLVVRNITVTHVYNDGYNVHGAQRSLVFENIAAIECGDDGFSAHEDGDCRIHGFVSIGNATGLCDTGTSRTYYKDVFIKDCVSYDLFFIGADHSLEDALVESSSQRAFSLDGSRLASGQVCTLRMRNVLLRRTGEGPQEMRIGRAGAVDAERCTIDGLAIQVTPGGSAAFRHCLVGGTPKPAITLWANTLWRAEGNVYDVISIRVDKTFFAPEKFADFQRLMGGDAGSQMGPLSAPDAGIGADEASLKKLRPPATSPDSATFHGLPPQPPCPAGPPVPTSTPA